MNFYFLRKPSTHGQVPFSTTDRHMGAKIVDCPVCGTRGMIGKNKLGRVPVEIVIRDIVDELDDIEQAGTVLLGSRKFREAVAAGGLTGRSPGGGFSPSLATTPSPRCKCNEWAVGRWRSSCRRA